MRRSFSIGAVIRGENPKNFITLLILEMKP